MRFVYFFSFIFLACVNPKQKAIDRILELETRLKLIEDLSSNEVLAYEVLSEYSNFLKLYPNAKIAPELFFKSGEVFKGLGLYLKAANSFYEVHAKYSNTSIAPLALFQQAHCFEILKQKITAKNTYEEFINRYPNHPYVEQAKGMIQLLYFSDEEIIQKFKN